MSDLKDILNNDDELNNDELMRYLEGNASEEERYAIEKQMADSSFVDDAVEGLQHFKDPDLARKYAEQLDRLRIACPEAVGAARVAGDPCFDRILASLPLRESYRQAFGVAPGQRLIVISSTWGRYSLYGGNPNLIQTLARRLPVDSYRIAVALHPNITHGHSRWQVRNWLAQCARDGVLVLDDEDDWRPALVAADLIVGDHGSVTFYAAALGAPILLASAPAHTIDPRSPIAALLRAAPRFDEADPLGCVERTIAGHDPNRYAEITALTTSCPGEAAIRLRRACYELLELRPPTSAAPPVAALPTPTGRFVPPRATLVTVELGETSTERLCATVNRWPAGSVDTPELMPQDAHLVVDADGPLTGMLAMADIVVHRAPREADRDADRDADRWVARTLRALPGCLLALARDRDRDCWLLGTADGGRVRLRTRCRNAPVFASVLYAWLTAGHPIDALPTELLVRPALTQSSSDSLCWTATARAENPRVS